MKEKISEIWEELRVTIRGLRRDLREKVAEDIDLDSEGGIVQTITKYKQIADTAIEICNSLEGLFWVNKLRKEEKYDKD